MSTPNDNVFIYVLQRISDKAYLYIGSAKNPARRFCRHRQENCYAAIQSAFAANNIRFLVIAQTDEVHRIDVEHNFWKQFVEAGHPIVNIDPAATSWEYGHLPWNKGRIGLPGKKHSQETREKLSLLKKGVPQSEEHKRNLSIVRTGKKQSTETRRKRSESLKGRKRKPMSEEQKQHLSRINKGKKQTKETREKISRSMRGHSHPCSQETKAKISATLKKRHEKHEDEKCSQIS